MTIFLGNLSMFSRWLLMMVRLLDDEKGRFLLLSDGAFPLPLFDVDDGGCGMLFIAAALDSGAEDDDDVDETARTVG